MSVERLARVAKAAGYAMATPDDGHLLSTPSRTDRAAWKSSDPKAPSRQLVVQPKSAERSAKWKDWLQSMTFWGRQTAS
jgi:hypothetical protein